MCSSDLEYRELLDNIAQSGLVDMVDVEIFKDINYSVLFLLSEMGLALSVSRGIRLDGPEDL